ncbi:MAG: RNA-binding domain-containing protein [Candidatus Altiarchaeota archaeon]
MKIHYAIVNAFSREDGLEALKKSFEALIPEGVSVSQEVLEPEEEGEVFTHKLYLLESRIEKSGAEDFFRRITGSLDEYDREELASGVEEHVDDDCIFYIRLSKREASGGRIVLDSRDCIHVKFKIAAYPATRENTLNVIGELMKDAGILRS